MVKMKRTARSRHPPAAGCDCSRVSSTRDWPVDIGGCRIGRGDQNQRHGDQATVESSAREHGSPIDIILTRFPGLGVALTIIDALPVTTTPTGN